MARTDFSLRHACYFQFPDDSSPPTDSQQHAPPTSESFDFLGQEMADLQQLLVSMVSGNLSNQLLEFLLQSVYTHFHVAAVQ